MHKIIRFIQIDIQYVISRKFSASSFADIFITDLVILLNLILKILGIKVYLPVIFSGHRIKYDTPFATKTFLAASYDFYRETLNGSILTQSPTIVDIGANIGQFLFATKTHFPNAKVMSFEPDERIFEMLKDNSKELKKVFLHNVALSNKNGKIDFYESLDFSEWSTLSPSDRNGNYKIKKVLAKKGDQFFSNIKKIDLLKIDVEGAELSVIEGLSNTLKKTRFLLLEISIIRDQGKNSTNKLIEILFAKGFSIYYIGRIFSSGPGKEQIAIDILFRRNG